MKLLERNDVVLERPVPRCDPTVIEENTLSQMRTFMDRRGLEVLAAPQVGVPDRIILGRLEGNIQAMLNPRLVYYDDEDYLYMKVPTLHSINDFTAGYWNHITLEWDWCGNSTYTERCDMYGTQAFLYQHALDYLDGQPPWKYKKLVDW